WYAKFASITQAGWFVLVIVILSIVKVDGQPLMNAAKHFKEGAIWGFITTVGIFSMIGGALSNDNLGFKTWLTDILQPIFSNMSWPVYVLLLVVVCGVVTNFFSNMATGVIVSSLTAPFTIAFAQGGINISVIATAIAFTSMFAYITYAAAGPAPILLGKEGITPKFIWTKGLAMLPVYIVVATVLFSLLGLVL
ncbi:MAG: anion permease, partial [Firmicutes bacterium]|nr:anion permease [Bacillota bacterium]